MRAAKMMCGQRKKPIALKKGGNPVAKSLASPALKPKVIKPKKGKGAYTRKGKALPMSSGGKSTVNKAGNYTKPTMRKSLFNKIKAGGKGGAPGQWSARKAQMLAKQYKAAGGGYRD
jgi:stalled ribosome alternative rescue factor ArfA